MHFQSKNFLNRFCLLQGWIKESRVFHWRVGLWRRVSSLVYLSVIISDIVPYGKLLISDAYNIMQGIDQLRPSLGLQVQKPNLPTQNQFLLASQQQQALAQAQAQGNLGNSPNYGFGGVPRGNFNAKDGQPPRNDGSICSPVQSNSPKVASVSLFLNNLNLPSNFIAY